MGDATSESTTHDLLLALAGRLDDDLLSWARELVALGEDARAVEILTASLVAARTVLPPQVHAALVAAARTTRTDLGPSATLAPPHPEDGTPHRFAAPDGNDPVAGAVLDLPARPLTGCSVLLARRLTPAGSAPGPLPHPVVLVEVHAGSRPADVIAYQLAAALERAGASASVEVLPADGPVPDYHVAALNCAVELRGGEAADRPWRPAPVPHTDRTEDRDPVPVPPHPLSGPEPVPDRASDDALARRRIPTVAAPQPTDPDVDAQARRRDPDPPVIEGPPAETGRLLPAAGRRRPEPVEVESATAQLHSESGHAFLFGDDHHNNDHHNNDHHNNDHHSNDEQDGDEDDVPDGDSHDRDDDRDDTVDTRGLAEEAFPEPPSPHPLAAPRPLPVRDESRPARPMPLPPSSPTPVQQPANRPRPTVTPISRPAVSNPIPLRRNGPAPIPRPLPVTEQRPALRRVDDRDDLEPPAPDRAERPAADRIQPRPQDPMPARDETPAFESLSDPLNGPLHQPLLAPLLDPTSAEDDPIDGARQRRERRDQPDDEWSDEWLSGRWAMAPSAFEDGAEARQEREPALDPTEDVEPDRPPPRPAPRHRYANEPAGVDESLGPEHDRAADGDGDGVDSDPERPDLGLRPESIARLSDADRQLLARLQAELLEGRRQRIGRRIINGSGATTNGNHRGPPPDLVS